MTTDPTQKLADAPADPSDGGPQTGALRAMMRQIAGRDERIRTLSSELERRTRRVDQLEKDLRAEGIPSDRSPVMSYVQAFWMEGGTPSEVESVRAEIGENGATHELLLELPVGTRGVLRIDLGGRPGFWELEELALFEVGPQGSAARAPVAIATAGNGYQNVTATMGMLRLAGPGVMRLYSWNDDPQVAWKLPVPRTGPSVLRVKCRAMGLVRGLPAAEHAVFREVFESYSAQASKDAREARGLSAKLAEAVGKIESAIARTAELSKLGDERAAMAATAERLSRELAERDARAGELETALAQAERDLGVLRPELEKLRGEQARGDLEVSATRAMLERTARAHAEMAALRSEAARAARESAGSVREVEALRRELRAARAAGAVQAANAVGGGASAELVGELESLRREVRALRARPMGLPAGEGEVRSLRRRLRRSAVKVARSVAPGLMPRRQVTPPPPGADHADVRALFDLDFYLEQNADIAGAVLADPTFDAFHHYLRDGWREGRDPHPLFSTAYYTARRPDVVASGYCPLLHFVMHGCAEGVSPHPLFDVRYYLHLHADVRRSGVNPLIDYLRHHTHGRRPHPLFDERYYLHHYPDVRRSGQPALYHYLRRGAAERRKPHPLFDPGHYAARNPDLAHGVPDLLRHFVEYGHREGRDPHPLFDVGHYLRTNPGVAAAGMNPLEHYVVFGWREGRDPHPHFDVSYYLKTNPDVVSIGMEPLEHFVNHGWREGRDPSAEFDCAFYLACDPTLLKRGINPLVHCLQGGRDLAPRRAADALPASEPLRLTVLLPEVSPAVAVAYESVSPLLRVMRADRYEPAVGDYVYAPSDVGAMLSPGHLKNVLLCLAFQAYDFVVVSHGLTDPPAVVAVGGAEATVLSADAYARRKRGEGPAAGARGRVVRLLPPPEGVPAEKLRTLAPDELGLGSLMASGAELSVRGANVVRRAGARRRLPPGRLFAPPASGGAGRGKPLALVMPSVLHVGGVERNMVEVLRALGDRYDAVIVTDVPHGTHAGSLHHQALRVAHGVFDLGELASTQELYLPMLAELRDSLRPELVWICNGSVWLSNHAREFRELFAATAIVDQQAYDEKHGWIEHFSISPGLRTFDRYVAINSRIRKAFVADHGIEPGLVELIYHMIDDARFNLARADEMTESGRAAALEKFGLPAGVPLFAQVGRLTAQKCPLDFLDLARRAALAKADAHFVLVGSGELAGDCDKFIAEHGLTNVTRVPFIEDPSGFYPLLSALVMASAFEGLPIVILENLSMGVPVLSTDVGDVRLVLEEYGSGMVVGDGGAVGGERMFAAFEAFVSELPKYAAAARARADEVNARFSAASIGRQYAECFERARLAKGARIEVGATQGISIVMPTYNRADQLRRTLLLCHQYAGGVPLEFVVVDDGSRDSTAEVLREVSARVPDFKFRSVPNAGPGQARNLGASLARHEIVLFMGDDAEPADDRFFSTHLELHSRDGSDSLAVLGKMIWPDTPDDEVSFAMAHIQGSGGEQFGYADFRPYSVLDWRFFYTANISVRRRVVADWTADGFRREFRFAAYEDAEFAYRLSKRPQGLRILYAPSSVGYHRHPYSVDQFLNRQTTAGMMARVMADMHPEVAEMIVPREVLAALAVPIRHWEQTSLADHTSVVEGLKAYARLIDTQRKLGSVYWHKALLHGVFEVAYLQGFLAATDGPEANHAHAYRAVLDRFYARTQNALQTEMLGYRAKPDKVLQNAVT